MKPLWVKLLLLQIWATKGIEYTESAWLAEPEVKENICGILSELTQYPYL